METSILSDLESLNHIRSLLIWHESYAIDNKWFTKESENLFKKQLDLLKQVKNLSSNNIDILKLQFALDLNIEDKNLSETIPFDDNFEEKFDKMITRYKDYHPKIHRELFLNTEVDIVGKLKKIADLVKNIIKELPISSGDFKTTYTANQITDFINTHKNIIDLKFGNYSAMFPINNTQSTILISKKWLTDENKLTTSLAHELGHSLYHPIHETGFRCGLTGFQGSITIHEIAAITTELLLGGFDKAINKHELRLKSDKLTYIIHIYIRCLIEQELLDNTISARELDKRWKELYKEYLDIDVSDISFRQDPHWASGNFGYFYSYAFAIINAFYYWETLHHNITGDINQDVAMISDFLENTFGHLDEFVVGDFLTLSVFNIDDKLDVIKRIFLNN